MTSLFSGLQTKLGMEESSGAREMQDIIDRIREYLTQKRYLIVVDDLWDESTWKIISCAFAEGGNKSRVIVTTRVDDVALYACCNDRECIYRMKPLEEQDSRTLFFNRVFGSEDGCPPQFKVVSAEILKKGGGLPLAIITIASLLDSCQARSMNEWESIRNSLDAKFAAKPTLEEMRSILNLSYIHLPLHLRACLLYLGMYPEDRTIERDELAQQWVAEGFINHLHGSDLEDVAKSYFNELINRSLIQPEHAQYGEVLSCRVHDMMLDLILTKCAKDNFISVAYNCEDMARLHGCEYKVRRLSLKSSGSGATSGTINTSLSQVRSFAWFGESNYTPPLPMFKYLRVLVIEFAGTLDKTVDLTSIGQLFHLRYLKIRSCSTNLELPTQIQGLVYLETLDLSCGLKQNIPSDIVLLSRLSHLILFGGTGLPKGIRNIKSLCTLNCIITEKSSLEDIKGIGELTNLRTLVLFFLGHKAVGEVNDAFATSIGKLRNLKRLSVCCQAYRRIPEHYDDQLYSLSDPPPNIESLDLSLWPFKGVPKWIGDLHCLRVLDLCVEHLWTEEVHALGKLPSLVRLKLDVLPSLVQLKLDVLHVPEDDPAIICTGLFPALESLRLCSNYDDVTACIVFEVGAMPNLQILVLVFGDMWGGATPVGMEHLSALQQIHLYISPAVEFEGDTESVFRNAAEVHPNRPSVTVG